MVSGTFFRFQQALASIGSVRAGAQLAAHERVHDASHAKGRITITPVLPVDVLGAYVLLPMPGTGSRPTSPTPIRWPPIWSRRASADE